MRPFNRWGVTRRGSLGPHRTMPEDLIQYWSRCHLDAPRFVHPDDLPFLKKDIESQHPTSFGDFLSCPRFGNRKDKHFHLSLRPVPYVGDVRRAKVVILTLNPGLEFGDYWAEFEVPEFRRSLERNLYQSFDHTGYPFLCLNPQFCWWGGFRWWEGKLRDVIRRIADLRFSGSYLEALRFMAQNLACLELFPYHSTSFAHHGLRKSLPSALQAQSFFQKHLKPDAIEGKRTVIVTRQTESWKIEKSKGDLIVYGKGQARGASLSADSKGGKAILKRFGIF